MQKPKEEHMREAIRLSMENVESEEDGPLGCVVVKAGKSSTRGATIPAQAFPRHGCSSHVLATRQLRIFG